MGQIQFMGAILLAILFAVAIIGYVTNFGNDNDVAINLNDDPDIISTQSDLESNLIVFYSQTNSSLSALDKSTISGNDATTTTGGQFKGGVSGAYNALKDVLNIFYKKIFGSEQGHAGFGIFLTALISFLALVLGLYIWQTWAGKTP